ncbi:MAG: hypothetical protein HYR75_00030 [Gemmatimonadetes bacterium]|nr:hypothetical protein [Gemmatimonadota bacterium]MBI3402167.1 hypothetical protein [Acidobacteriota bacterium]
MDLQSADVIVSWASLYANHAAMRTAVVFAHVGGLTVGGGCAIAADRATLTVPSRDEGARTGHLQYLGGIHRIITISLVFITVSGLLLFASDLDTFLYSKVFWIKMGLMALLLVNGALLRRAERRARHGSGAAWATLRTVSLASLALWLLTTLAGVALPNLS